MRLLDKLKFDDARDKIWLAGDLVNRGPKSLKTLRYVSRHDHCIETVLGNHDLHLLRLSVLKSPRINPTLKKLVNASDFEELMDWLRQQPLMTFDPELNTAISHAGIWPGWSIDTALDRAAEVEDALRGKKYKRFLKKMPGNAPDKWSGKLNRDDRLRFIVNAFTRMRMVYPDGRLALRFSGPPSKAKSPLLPWYAIRKRKARKTRAVFGHWSSLGFKQTDRIVSLDTGCVWGRRLTAVRLDKDKKKPVSVSCRCEQ